MQSKDTFKTILVIVTGLLALAWIFNTPLLGRIALITGLVCIVIPPAATAVGWIWWKLATALGWANSRIILSVIYFVFLMPIAWASRLFTRDPLALRKDNHATMFVTRDHLYSKKDLENVW